MYGQSVYQQLSIITRKVRGRTKVAEDGDPAKTQEVFILHTKPIKDISIYGGFPYCYGHIHVQQQYLKISWKLTEFL